MPFSTPRLSLCPAALVLLLLAVSGAGCGRQGHEHDHKHSEQVHHHDAKHGGSLIAVGDEEFHLEITFGGDMPGVLQAYIMDAHAEDYVRIALPSFEATALHDGQPLPLVFHATTSVATGETVGDSALFEARADWLLDQPSLSLTVPVITIKGRTYHDLAVTLPARTEARPQSNP